MWGIIWGRGDVVRLGRVKLDLLSEWVRGLARQKGSSESDVISLILWLQRRGIDFHRCQNKWPDHSATTKSATLRISMPSLVLRLLDSRLTTICFFTDGCSSFSSRRPFK